MDTKISNLWSKLKIKAIMKLKIKKFVEKFIFFILYYLKDFENFLDNKYISILRQNYITYLK